MDAAVVVVVVVVVAVGCGCGLLFDVGRWLLVVSCRLSCFLFIASRFVDYCFLFVVVVVVVVMVVVLDSSHGFQREACPMWSRRILAARVV